MTFYGHTNESLQGIRTGLQAGPDDTVLAICGSGDQAFMLLEYAKRVIAIDNNPAQVEYAKERASDLRGGNVGMFVYAPALDYEFREAYAERNRYLGTHAPDIRENIENIEFHVANIAALPDHIANTRFTRFYLSNVLEYASETYLLKAEHGTGFLRALAGAPDGARVYSAGADDDRPSIFRNFGFHYDREASRRAREFETEWWPFVYVKDSTRVCEERGALRF
ncbi:TPA: hypothetical protein HA251_05285 [Candidatus Woesearchaeota archaeon]|nr:hypothetical protein [Candidatus Woesearchaeota archaeon]